MLALSQGPVHGLPAPGHIMGKFLSFFFKSQMFFANHGTSRHVEKGAPVGPKPILLGPIDTGTIPLCGGLSAKPDCKHKHYEIIYVKHYERSIVSQQFVCFPESGFHNV